jgi:hypothetical protein
MYTGFSLLGMQIVTPGNTAVIDTDIYLPGQGYAYIDSSMVSGTMYLPQDSGYIISYSGFDSVPYPRLHFSWRDLVIPAPPMDCSAAKFYCWVWDTSFYEYFVATDWYIDPTPTFGWRNDDYPGCTVSGTVYGNSNPIAGAELIAHIQSYSHVYHPEPYYTQCTTYSQTDGFYTFDSLLPLQYVISASAPGYLTHTQTTDDLRALRPLTDFDFDLIGIQEDHDHYPGNGLTGISVFPNPFNKNLTIKFQSATILGGPNPPRSPFAKGGQKGDLLCIAIYDATGRLVKSFDLPTTYSLLPTEVIWDGSDETGKRVPPGIYYCSVATPSRHEVEKVILLK